MTKDLGYIHDPDWRAKMRRAMDLEQRLWREGYNGFRWDALSEYRKWLDEQGIDAEEDGWPNDAAYAEANITAFLADWKARWSDDDEA